MGKLKNKGKYIAIGIAILLLASGLIVYSSVFTPYPDKAQQIAAMSGVEVETVMRLYAAEGDWDKLLTNIMVYKELLSIADEAGAVKQLYKLIPKYDATDLYIVFDYFAANGLSLADMPDALDQKLKGEEWETLLAKYSAAKTYNHYRGLNKDKIKGLLAQGCLPEDIKQADTMAKAKDLTIEQVMQAKTADVTWAHVAQIFNYRGAEYRPHQIKMPDVKGQIAARELADLMKDNQSGMTKQQNDQSQIKSELNLINEQINKYLAQGFNAWEVRNAYKLAQANGVTPEEVLNKKMQGLSWSDILASYPNK